MTDFLALLAAIITLSAISGALKWLAVDIYTSLWNDTAVKPITFLISAISIGLDVFVIGLIITLCNL